MKNHTRYRAVITSSGMEPFILRGKNQERLTQKARNEIKDMRSYWNAPIHVSIEVADNIPSTLGRESPNWRLVEKFTDNK